MKQRVIGAIVLVALAVIFLPMLLQGPNADRGGSDVPLDMPDPPERSFEVRELPLSLPPPVEADAEPETAAEGRDETAVTAVETEAPARIDPADESTPAPATPPEAAAEADPAPVAPAVGDYLVQLGSYRDAANAQALLATLRQAGLPAYTEQVESGGQTVTRLRMGPYARRGEAEAARLKVRELRPDVPTQVVAGARSEPETAAARRLPDTGFVVQVGAFAKVADAQSLRDRLRSAGFPAFIEPVQTAEGTLHRVRAGPEIDRASAERLRARIRAGLQLDGTVLAFP